MLTKYIRERLQMTSAWRGGGQKLMLYIYMGHKTARSAVISSISVVLKTRESNHIKERNSVFWKKISWRHPVFKVIYFGTF